MLVRIPLIYIYNIPLQPLFCSKIVGWHTREISGMTRGSSDSKYVPYWFIYPPLNAALWSPCMSGKKAPLLRHMDNTCVGRFLILSVLLTSISNRNELNRIISCQFRRSGLGIVHRQESVRKQERWNPVSKQW